MVAVIGAVRYPGAWISGTVASHIFASMAPRIVSLIPSATEIVYLVGAGPHLVGRSHECDFPEEALGLPFLTGQKNAFVSSKDMNDKVSATLKDGGGLYSIDGEKLSELRPDFIITQSLCAVCAVSFSLVEEIAQTMDPRPRIIDLNPQVRCLGSSCLTWRDARGMLREETMLNDDACRA